MAGREGIQMDKLRREVFKARVAHPGAKWCIGLLCKHPLLEWSMVQEWIKGWSPQPNPSHPLAPGSQLIWLYLACNPGIGPEGVEYAFQKLPINARNCRMLSKGIPWFMVEKHMATYPWCFTGLSYNRGLSKDFVLQYRDEAWYDVELCDNPALTVPDLMEILPKGKWGLISRCPNVRWEEDVFAMPDVPWDWGCLSIRVPLDVVMQHPDKPWNWWTMSINPHVTIDFVTKMQDKPWNWRELAHRLPVFQLRPMFKGDMDVLLFNPHVSWRECIAVNRVRHTREFKQDIPFRAVIEEYLSGIEDGEYAKLFADYDQDNKSIAFTVHTMLEDFSRNKGLTWNVVRDYIDLPWSWSELTSNRKLFEPLEEEIVEWARKRWAARRIMRVWVDPVYAMCRRRLMREWGDESKDLRQTSNAYDSTQHGRPIIAS